MENITSTKPRMLMKLKQGHEQEVKVFANVSMYILWCSKNYTVSKIECYSYLGSALVKIDVGRKWEKLFLIWHEKPLWLDVCLIKVLLSVSEKCTVCKHPDGFQPSKTSRHHLSNTSSKSMKTTTTKRDFIFCRHKKRSWIFVFLNQIWVFSFHY